MNEPPKTIIMWMLTNDKHEAVSKGIVTGAGRIPPSEESLNKQGLELVQKVFELDYDHMEIYPVEHCRKHGTKMHRMRDIYFCGECIEEMKQAMPEGWRKDVEAQNKIFREALEEHNRKIKEGK